jgi:outer membrane biosynthesis protein TonB
MSRNVEFQGTVYESTPSFVAGDGVEYVTIIDETGNPRRVQASLVTLVDGPVEATVQAEEAPVEEPVEDEPTSEPVAEPEAATEPSDEPTEAIEEESYTPKVKPDSQKRSRGNRR